MNTRLKSCLSFFALGFLPLGVLALAGFLYSQRTENLRLQRDVEDDLQKVVADLQAEVRRASLPPEALARSSALSGFLARSSQDSLAPAAASAEPPPVPAPELVAVFETFFAAGSPRFISVVLLNSESKPVLRASRNNGQGAGVRIETEAPASDSHSPNPTSLAALNGRAEASVFKITTDSVAISFSSAVTRSSGVRREDAGAILATADVRPLLDEVASRVEGGRASERRVIISDTSGRILYVAERALLYQPLESATGSFAEEMKAAGAGSPLHFTTGDSSREWHFAARRSDGMGVVVAAGRNTGASFAGIRRVLIFNLVISAILALAFAYALDRRARKQSRRLERITADADNIAQGRLETGIGAVSVAEMRPLAGSLDAIREQMRDQLAREAELRQFESFMRLAAMLTHDLKNAISTLSMLVANMERKFDSEEFRADAMASVRAATERLQRLVSRLSNPVTALSGEFKRPVPVDLHELISLVFQQTAAQARAPIETENSVPHGLTAMVAPDRIERVFENLVLNAIEAMTPDGGKLVASGRQQEDGSVAIEITDTGPGMSEAFIREKLFHAFSSTKRGGIGLGLYTCREVVNALGGKMEAISQKGSGTTFRVVLPSAKHAGQ